MSDKELNVIQELIERKILLSEVSGGLTSSDKKIISLWNYTMVLQNNRIELKKWLEECLKENNKSRLYDNNSYQAGVIDTYENVIDKIKELEEGVK